MTPHIKALLFSLTMLFATAQGCWAQDTTTSNSNKFRGHSVKKAVIMSSILPGLGQVYNRKWWKVPIIYGGLGTLGYFAYRNNQYHVVYKREYLRRQCPGGCVEIGESQLSWDPYLADYEDAALVQLQAQYRRYRDLCFVGFAAVWALQIVDAAVDAQMFDFDISPDLSLHWSPQLGLSNGAVVALRF